MTKRNLTQWYFKVTDFVQRLLDDMDSLQGNWPERVLTMQRNWIGRSEGAHVDFVIGADESGDWWPDGHGVHHAAGHAVRRDVLRDRRRLRRWRRRCAHPSSARRSTTYLREVQRTTEIERLTEGREKTGVVLGRLRDEPGHR